MKKPRPRLWAPGRGSAARWIGGRCVARTMRAHEIRPPGNSNIGADRSHAQKSPAWAGFKRAPAAALGLGSETRHGLPVFAASDWRREGFDLQAVAVTSRRVRSVPAANCVAHKRSAKAKGLGLASPGAAATP